LYDDNNQNELQTARLTLLDSLAQSIAPGGGEPTVPYAQMFSAFFNTAYKIYLNPSIAYQMAREDAVRMRHSLHVAEPLQARKLSTALLSWHIEPEDAHDNEQQSIATKLQHQIDETPDLLQLFMHLLDQGIWVGRGGVQVYFRWDLRQGKRMLIGSWEPVQGDSIRFRWSDERPGILVLPYFVGRGTKYFDPGTTVPSDEARLYILSDWERDRFLIHKQGIEAADFHEAQHAGYKHGKGCRDYCFFSWRLQQETLALLHTYTERISLGQQIWRYSAANPQQQAKVEGYAESQHFNNVFTLPGIPNQGYKDYEMVEPNGGGFDGLKWICQDYYGSMIRRFISGYSPFVPTTKDSGAGGTTDFQQDQARKIMLYDSTCLADTLTRDLVAVLLKHNFPGCQARFRFKFNVEKQSSDEYLKGVRGFYDLGGTVCEAEVRSKLGLKTPGKDDAVLRRTLTGMEQDEQGGSVADDIDDSKGDEKDPKGKTTILQAIRAAINELGPNAKASEVMSHLEANGVKASRSHVYNELKRLHGSSRNESQTTM
jgi:hypothetical protein